MCAFAPELWITIFQKGSKADWLVLSRTCRTFRQIAQEQLYKDIIASPPTKEDSEVFMGLFERSITENPSLARLVRTLRCCRWLVLNNQNVYDLSPFSHLQNLELSSVCITLPLCNAIRLLPSLVKVQYASCDIGEDLITCPARITWGQGITTVIFKSPWLAGCAALIPPTTRYFKILTDPDLQKIPSSIMYGPFVQGLDTLVLQARRYPDNIIDFLLTCRNLRKLTLLPITSDDRTFLFHTLPPHALPLLEHFEGHSSYAPVYIAGRPIRSAIIHLQGVRRDRPDQVITRNTQALLSLRHSLVCVTELVISGLGELELTGLAPTMLRTLVVHVHGHDAATCHVNGHILWHPMLSTIPALQSSCRVFVNGHIPWLPMLSNMPTLQSLRIIGAVFSPAEHEKLVEAASRMCASLREFTFERWDELDQLQHVQYTWRWRKDGPWECYTCLEVD